jgi:transcription termination factor Rho
VSVLQRKELEDSPLADLHAIASELGIEGYRALRKEDLIAAIVDVQGGGDSDSHAGDETADEEERPRRGRRRGGRGRGRSRDKEEDAPKAEQPDGEIDDEPAPAAEPEGEATQAADDEEERETVEGVLDLLSNGSGFLRRADASDVYVSPAQIRRCELRAGDSVAGPVRPARRNERHPSLVRVERVNGRDADAPESRSTFDDLTPVHPTERLAAPAALDGAPFGKGSRVAIAGPSGAGATRLLREIVAGLAAQPGSIELTVVLAGARPEEIAEWRAATEAQIHGGSFDSSPEEHAQAAQLAIEQAKRVVERGGDAIVVVDSLATLPAAATRRVFGAGRKAEQGGSLTVLAAVGEDSEALRIASTRIVLAPGGAEPKLDADRSGAQRADLLG